MKKWLIPILITSLVMFSACSPQGKSAEDKESQKTIIYQSEKGPVEVPADPKRVVVLSSFAGNVMALDVHLVGVDSWSKMNPRWKKTVERGI